MSKLNICLSGVFLLLVPGWSLLAHTGSHSMNMSELLAHFISSPTHIGVTIFLLALVAIVALKVKGFRGQIALKKRDLLERFTGSAKS